MRIAGAAPLGCGPAGGGEPLRDTGRRAGAPSAPAGGGGTGLAEQVSDDVAEVPIEEEARMRAVLGEELPAAVDEDVVREVVVALGVDLERGQQPAAIEEHLVPVHVGQAVGPAGLLRDE